MYSSLKELIDNYKVQNQNEKVPLSERHELVGKFAKKINERRIVDGMKPLPHSFFNIKMSQSGLKDNWDLYWFYKYCDETKNFDKTWWWSLRIK